MSVVGGDEDIEHSQGRGLLMALFRPHTMSESSQLCDQKLTSQKGDSHRHSDRAPGKLSSVEMWGRITFSGFYHQRGRALRARRLSLRRSRSRFLDRTDLVFSSIHKTSR
jgi:hypothetical protein